MIQYGGMSSELSIAGLIALAAYLSVFTGLAGSLISRAPLFMAPVIWITKDLAVEKILGGFPWCQAGYSQFQNIYFIQVAEWGGIHLITFILIGFNVLLYQFFKRRNKTTAIALLASLACIYVTGYILYQINENHTASLPTHHAGIIQPNTNNDYIELAEKHRILARLFRESEQLVQQGAEFILWPEHSVALYPLQNQEDCDLFLNFASTHVPLLAGFTDRQNYNEIYNSYILFAKDRFEKYDKVHLAPFGEYVLFRKWLFFIKRITDEIGDFTPGAAVKNLTVNNHAVATPICYEIIFPELVRDFVANGAEVIVTGSNDSWFGDTSAPFQHLGMAVFRSVENRRYILRTTTNGISGVIAPSGNIVQRVPRSKPEHFIANFKYVGRTTVFTCCGYLFPYLCLVLTLGFFLGRRFLTWRKSKHTDKSYKLE